jgi:hypothetical protein
VENVKTVISIKSTKRVTVTCFGLKFSLGITVKTKMAETMNMKINLPS